VLLNTDTKIRPIRRQIFTKPSGLIKRFIKFSDVIFTVNFMCAREIVAAYLY